MALVNYGLRIQIYRQKSKLEPYLFTKIYIPYEALLENSEFKYPTAEHYSSVQRAYAIKSILDRTVIYVADDQNEKKLQKFDYLRLCSNNIYLFSYIPHESKYKLNI